MLAAGFFALPALGALHGAIDDREDLGSARAQRIHGAGLDQAFDHAPVEQARVHAVTKLVNGSEAAQLCARFEDSLHRILTDVFNGLQAEADGFADRSEVKSAGIEDRKSVV